MARMREIIAETELLDQLGANFNRLSRAAVEAELNMGIFKLGVYVIQEEP